MSDPDHNADAEMQVLVERMMDGSLPETEFQELERMLLHDSEARESYFRHVWLEHSLGTIFVGSSTKQKSKPLTLMGRRTKWSLTAAAAAALVIFSFMYLRQSPEPAAMAQLRICENSQWTIDGMMNPGDSTLSRDKDFHLLQGVAELELPNGVTAIVDAPARLSLIDGRTMKLDYGRAFFRVGREGRGFAVLTPHQRIVDLGTEFGIDCTEHQSQAKLRVFKGRVRAEPPSGGTGGELIKEGRTVLLEESRVASDLANDTTWFRQALPASVETLLVDDFEYGLKDDEVQNAMKPAGWESRGIVGVYNPNGNGRWIDHAGVDDNSPSKGEIGAMRGPNLGFFCGEDIRNCMIRRNVASIAPNSRYTVSVAIGVRSETPREREVFDGYTIRLISGETTLAELSSDTPPGPFNSVTSVGFSWDSSVMPTNVKAGDPLTLEIAPNGAARSASLPYLDFDNVRVSVLGR